MNTIRKNKNEVLEMIEKEKIYYERLNRSLEGFADALPYLIEGMGKENLDMTIEILKRINSRLKEGKIQICNVCGMAIFQDEITEKINSPHIMDEWWRDYKGNWSSYVPYFHLHTPVIDKINVNSEPK